MANFFTFYSFKGGVGRSMALANVADILARRGLRVLAIDFDLEAPGLERYFQVEKTAALANPGLIDLLQSFKKSLSGAAPLDDAAEFRQLERFIFPVFQRPLANGGELHLLTAGQRGSAAQYKGYALAVRTFDWQDFYFNWEGEAFFDWLRTELSAPAAPRQPYDVVLIDSRTGVTEMGGVCAYQLADVMVMLCAANHQNVEGTRAVVQDFRSESVRALRRGRPLEMVVVPARIEQRDDAQLEAFFQRFDGFFGDELPPGFAEAGLGFRDLTIPYQPEYAFEEVVVSDPERREQRRAIGGAFDRLADALTLVAADDGGRLARLRAAALASLRAGLAAARAALAPPSVADMFGQPSAAPALDRFSPPSPGVPVEADLSKALGLDNAFPGSAVQPPAALVNQDITRFDPTRRFAGYDAFVSYAAADQPATDALAQALRDAGLAVFVDNSALTAGDQVGEATAQALHHSRHLLVCAGAQGVSPWQKREIELARSANQAITVVPVLLPGADQDIFSLALRGVADVQALDLRGWPAEGAAFARLLALLRGGSGAARAAEPGSGRAAPADNPYAGVQSYDEGRVTLLDLPQATLDDLQRQLQASGLALLVGPSGAGKGSLVAALVARLRQDSVAAGRPFSLLRLRLTDDDAVARLSAPAPAGQWLVVEQVDRLPRALGPAELPGLWPEALLQRLAQATPDAPVLLVGIDLPLLSWRQPPMPEAPWWQRLQQQTVALDTPDAAAIRRAIEAPAQRSGYAFEPGLLDRLCQDVGDGPGALLLAQLVLTELWPHATRGFLTNAAYDACDGVAGVHARHLQARLSELPAALAAAARALLLRLAVLGDDGSVSWQPAVWEVVRTQPSLGEAGAQALLWLMGQRVISVWRSSPDQLQFSLLQPVARGRCAVLDGIVAEHHARLAPRRRLIAAVKVWQGQSEADDALLTGFRLAEARTLQRDWADHVCAAEQQFIARSAAHGQAAELRALRTRRLAALLATVAIVGVPAVVWQRHVAAEANARAAQMLQQANETIKATIAQSTGKAQPTTLDPALFAGLRIVPQYKDARDEATVQALIASLRAYGLTVTAPERVPADKATCGDVRVFAAKDQPAAVKLQDAVEQVLLALGYSVSPDLIDLSLNTRLAAAGAGTLELWLPPLAAAVKPEGLPASNPKDGAELRLVPAGCAQLGMAPEALRAAARAASQPVIELYKNDWPKQTQWVGGFQMYRTEVTNAQFAQFKAACGSGPACPVGWTTGRHPLQAPARFLSWAQADAYCRWAGGRLPTEQEWEKAARGTDGRLWPWGNQPDASRLQGKETSGGKAVAPVGSFPAGDSPYGIADLAGNLWEMTASPWPGGGHAMRGGSYLNPLLQTHSAWRWASDGEDGGADYLGFRCVVDLPAAAPKAAPASR